MFFADSQSFPNGTEVHSSDRLEDTGLFPSSPSLSHLALRSSWVLGDHPPNKLLVLECFSQVCLLETPRLCEAVTSPVSQGVVEHSIFPPKPTEEGEKKKKDPFQQFCISTARYRISSCGISGYMTATLDPTVCWRAFAQSTHARGKSLGTEGRSTLASSSVSYQLEAFGKCLFFFYDQ